MKAPVCRLCGGKVLYGNLYCSAECGRQAKATNSAAVAELQQRGFVRDPEVPNVWLKDGVATTIEHIAHVGLTKAMAHHGHAVEQRQA